MTDPLFAHFLFVQLASAAPNVIQSSSSEDRERGLCCLYSGWLGSMRKSVATFSPPSHSPTDFICSSVVQPRQPHFRGLSLFAFRLSSFAFTAFRFSVGAMDG